MCGKKANKEILLDQYLSTSFNNLVLYESYKSNELEEYLPLILNSMEFNLHHAIQLSGFWKEKKLICHITKKYIDLVNDGEIIRSSIHERGYQFEEFYKYHDSECITI